MRRALALLVVASCSSGENRPTPVQSTPVQNTTAMKPTPTAPAGWISIHPDSERLRCANWSKREWRVSFDGSAVAFAEVVEREPNTGPALPFSLPKGLNGRRHVLAVGNEFLVGLDAGEWGGSLHVFSADGKHHTELAKDNVRGLVVFGDSVVSIEGLSHLSLSEGNARWLHRDGGTWKQQALVPLDAGPYAFVTTKDAIYVVTLNSLVRLGPDHKATVVQPMRIGGLYPDSMIADDSGGLWVGMRHFVLQLTPKGDRYEEKWLVPEGCRRAHLDEVEGNCICDGD